MNIYSERYRYDQRFWGIFSYTASDFCKKTQTPSRILLMQQNINNRPASSMKRVECVCVCACVRVCVCVCGHVYVVYEDTNLYNDMGMT